MIIFGVLAGVKGFYHIIYADDLGNPIELDMTQFEEYYKIQHVEHKQTLFPLFTGITNNGIVNSSATKLNFTYDTDDIPSVRNDIIFTFEVTLREPEIVNHVYAVFDHPNYGDLLVDTKYLKQQVEYLKSFSSIYELEKKNFMQYYLKTEPREFGFENDIAIWLLVNNTKHGIEIIPVANRESTVHIHSYDEKLQIDTNRVSLAEISQNQINAKLQQKSNNVIEGISWIFLAGMLLQPAFMIWYSTFSNTRSKQPK